MFWLLLQKPNLSPSLRAAAQQEPREHLVLSVWGGVGLFVLFLFFRSPLERARDREVPLLLTTLVSLCLSDEGVAGFSEAA